MVDFKMIHHDELGDGLDGLGGVVQDGEQTTFIDFILIKSFSIVFTILFTYQKHYWQVKSSVRT